MQINTNSINRLRLFIFCFDTELPKAGIVPKYWYQSNPTSDRWSFHYSQLNLLSSTLSQPGKHTNLSEYFYAAKQTIIHSKRCSPFYHMDRMLSEGCFMWQNHCKAHRCVTHKVRHFKSVYTLTWGQCWSLSLVFPSLNHTQGSGDLNMRLSELGSAEVMLEHDRSNTVSLSLTHCRGGSGEAMNIIVRSSLG